MRRALPVCRCPAGYWRASPSRRLPQLGTFRRLLSPGSTPLRSMSRSRRAPESARPVWTPAASVPQELWQYRTKSRGPVSRRITMRQQTSRVFLRQRFQVTLSRLVSKLADLPRSTSREFFLAAATISQKRMRLAALVFVALSTLAQAPDAAYEPLSRAYEALLTRDYD